MDKQTINLDGVMVRLQQIEKHYYVSLQDIAKGYSPDDWYGLINDWLRQFKQLNTWGFGKV